MDISLPKRCLNCASLLPMRGSLLLFMQPVNFFAQCWDGCAFTQCMAAAPATAWIPAMLG